MFSEIHCIVKGRVQGVGYRDFVERYTKEHNLCGWIRNNKDGSVEMAIQGTPDELKACLEILNEGSLLAKVESLAVDWGTVTSSYTDFKIIAS